MSILSVTLGGCNYVVYYNNYYSIGNQGFAVGQSLLYDYMTLRLLRYFITLETNNTN